MNEEKEKHICETCEKKEGFKVMPNLADKEAAERMSYYSCNECFSSVWAGEN